VAQQRLNRANIVAVLQPVRHEQMARPARVSQSAHLPPNPLRQAVHFVSRVTRVISFHFVHLFNGKDLRQNG
jgi:hypothetical protein